MNKMDVSYASGFIDGEGYLQFENVKYKRKRIEVVGTEFTPIRLRINKNASSVVAGIENSDIENLIGSANFSALSIALMEKSTSNEDETIRACLFRLGKRLRIPLPIIAPCSKPIPKTVANVIKKFCSAKSNIFKSYSLQYKIKIQLILVITD